MILQALTEYYETMESRGEIAPPRMGSGPHLLCSMHSGGWNIGAGHPSSGKSARGFQAAPTVHRAACPSKEIQWNHLEFPMENSSYILGIDNNGKPQQCPGLILQHADCCMNSC